VRHGSHLPRLVALASAGALAGSVSPLTSAAAGAGAALQFRRPGPAESGKPAARLVAIDPENRTWRLQESADLIAWRDLGVTDVVNGERRTGVEIALANGGGGVDSPDLVPVGHYRLVLADEQIARTASAVLIEEWDVVDFAGRSGAGRHLGRELWPIRVTNEVAQLGRVLFYDRRLSADNSVSCASCHKQEFAFADNRRFSAGLAGQPTARNSMSLLQVRHYRKLRGGYFWDQRGGPLAESVLEPIAHPAEMGMALEELPEKLAAEPYYRELAARAFGTEVMGSEQIGTALAQFVTSLASYDSAYDEQVIREREPEQGAIPDRGRLLFESHCASCHWTDAFTTSEASNNGLEMEYADGGVGGRTGQDELVATFQTPSVRDVAVTGPYMHDGRFATLEEVVDHYDHGIVPHRNLGRTLTPQPLGLTGEEKAALVDFMKSLTSRRSLTDPALASPFRGD
jgi:cytochrome c peroxidase